MIKIEFGFRALLANGIWYGDKSRKRDSRTSWNGSKGHRWSEYQLPVSLDFLFELATEEARRRLIIDFDFDNWNLFYMTGALDNVTPKLGKKRCNAKEEWLHRLEPVSELGFTLDFPAREVQLICVEKNSPDLGNLANEGTRTSKKRIIDGFVLTMTARAESDTRAGRDFQWMALRRFGFDRTRADNLRRQVDVLLKRLASELLSDPSFGNEITVNEVTRWLKNLVYILHKNL
jgi:hypothetical protein